MKLELNGVGWSSLELSGVGVELVVGVWGPLVLACLGPLSFGVFGN